MSYRPEISAWADDLPTGRRGKRECIAARKRAVLEIPDSRLIAGLVLKQEIGASVAIVVAYAYHLPARSGSRRQHGSSDIGRAVQVPDSKLAGSLVLEHEVCEAIEVEYDAPTLRYCNTG